MTHGEINMFIWGLLAGATFAFVVFSIAMYAYHKGKEEC